MFLQLVHLVSVQLLGLAVLLCQVYHHAPLMVTVEDGGKVFCVRIIVFRKWT